MRVLIDTNIIMDYIVKRDTFSDAAEKVITLCMENDVQACIAAHTVPNLHYILRKYLTNEQRKDILLKICRMFTVIGIDAVKLVSALQDDNFYDFEDCLQVECAKDFGADFIVTRNAKDFQGSAVPVTEPLNFISIMSSL